MLEYEKEYPTCVDFAKELERLIQTVLRAKKIAVHSVTSRVKTRDSLEAKINGSPGRYSRLSDITDLVGVRVITYFDDDVDRVGRVLRRQFAIADAEDKRRSISPESFGYASLHYVVKLSPRRRRLLEYRRFRDCTAEIQVRSILQHAWAEIEHDLGYKTKLAVPQAYVRGFARIAGLLEVADNEFMRLRNELQRYERTIAAKIEGNPQVVPIDQASLLSLIQSDMVKTLDARIQKILGQPGIEFSASVLERMLRAVRYHNMGTIGDIQQALIQHADAAIRLFDLSRDQDKQLVAYAGSSILAVSDLLAAQAGSTDRFVDFVKRVTGRMDTDAVASLADRYLAGYREITARND
jgi:ppGpp synthetase/RelA/SpoT-type nucleotidyltranferase